MFEFFRRNRAEKSLSAAGDINSIREQLERSLDAKKLVAHCRNIGFVPQSEDALGLTLESSHGKLVVSVLTSHHKRNAFLVLYREERTGKKTCLVDEGKLQ